MIMDAVIAYTRFMLATLVAFGALQQCKSIQFQRLPSNPTIVVVGVNSTRVGLTWELTPSAGETIRSIFFKIRKPGDANPTLIASRTANSAFTINQGFKDRSNYEAKLDYTLVIVNARGVDKYVYFLSLQYEKNNIPQQAEYPVRVEVNAPPNITLAPGRELLLNIGQNFTLQCNATGVPHPTIIWTKDGVPVNKFNVSGYLLQLVEVQMKDAGSYRCTASNGYGNGTGVTIVGIRCSDCVAKKVGIILRSEDWIDALANQASVEFKSLESKLLSAIWSVYTKNPVKQLYGVNVDHLRAGSVFAVIELLFGKSATDPLRPLQDEINDGKLGPFAVDRHFVVKPTIMPSFPNTVTYSPFLDIHIRSEGCNDTGMTPGTCGIAYIKVNGKDYSPHGRGHNVVVVDAKTGAALDSKRFDTHGDPSAGVRLRDYLNAINGKKIVLVAIQDAGSTYLAPALNALKRLGAKDPILKDFRSSFALVGYAQSRKPSWITQEQQKRYEGPSEIFLRIPLKHSSQPPSFMNVELHSEGCDDPGKTGCGRALIKVNNENYSLHKRGFNVAVFTEQGLFLEARAFDTHGVLKAGISLANYLDRMCGNKTVLIAVQDSAARYGSAAIGALRRLGARGPIILEFRSSFALVSLAGSTFPSWVSQVQNKRYEGPSVLLVTIKRVSFLDISIRSEGCNDTGMTPGTCGIAYIKVNGKDYSLHRRGHNVVIVDAKTGAVLGSKSFDTHGVASAGVGLRNYLNSINGDKIVLVAIQDSGSTYVSPALNVLKRLGAKDPILKDFRGSFALVGYAQTNKPSWITQEQQKRYEGPSEVFLRIPLKQSSQPPSLMHVELRSEGCDDPGKTGGCGTAFIKVNNQDYSLHKRGFNVAVFSEQGLFLEAKAFDTYGVLKAGVSLANYLNRISGNKTVFIAVQDSAARYGSPAIGALKRLGAREPIILEFRSSFALASFASSTLPALGCQTQNKRYKGPSVLLTTIKRGH